MNESEGSEFSQSNEWTGYGRPPPSRISKLRIGFERDGLDYPVIWFRNVGENIHWGSAGGRQLVTPEVLPNGALSLEPPEDIEEWPLEEAHNSYHESGLRHLRVGDAQTDERGWLPRPANLREPMWLLSLTTRRADLYPPGRSMGRGGAAPLRIPLDADTASCRHQLEFWLTPPGEHTLPLLWKCWPSANPDRVMVPTPTRQCYRTLTPHLLLIIKHGVRRPGEFPEQIDDAEFMFSAFNTPTAEGSDA